jgi:hypothetical protein
MAIPNRQALPEESLRFSKWLALTLPAGSPSVKIPGVRLLSALEA